MPDEKVLNGKPTILRKDLEQFLPEGRSLGDLPTELVDELHGLQFSSREIISERFEIIEQLGFGGMGAVYKVKDLLMRGQLKALKVMLPSLVMSNEARERFISEAEIAQSLRHEGIATVFDIGRHRDILFLTMELLEGGQSLDRFLKSKGGRLGFLEAVDMVLKICEGLSYAHKKGVIHRDIKPQNIFVLPDGRVKVLDFGLAKLLSPGRLTQSSIGLGTAYYMSPEQSMGREVSERSDIFSLGVVFYQMLIGRIPMGRFKLPSTLNPSIPSTIDSVIEKCLDEQPEERYLRVESLVADIEQVRSAYEKEGKEKIEREQKAIAEKKRKIDSLLKKGKSALDRNSFDEAISSINEILLIDSEHQEARELLNRATVEKGRFEEVQKREEERRKAEELKRREEERSRRETEETERRREGGERRKVAGPRPEEVFRDKLTGMELVFVKGGAYQMGDVFGDGSEGERPVHEVMVSDFWIGKYPVTQGQWEKVMGNNPSYFKKGGNYPVESVSWDDIQEFIQKLNQKTGKKYRLPTEAEWEYAARSGGKKEKWAGTSNESELGEYAWYSKNSGDQTHPVGQKKPNGLGLYDMSGNVWECCEDWYDKDYYRNSPRDNPKGPSSGQYRVLRGGSWGCNPGNMRASYRNRIQFAYWNITNGFRLVLPSE